jgi:hypothetical protein
VVLLGLNVNSLSLIVFSFGNVMSQMPFKIKDQVFEPLFLKFINFADQTGAQVAVLSAMHESKNVDRTCGQPTQLRDTA